MPFMTHGVWPGLEDHTQGLKDLKLKIDSKPI